MPIATLLVDVRDKASCMQTFGLALEFCFVAYTQKQKFS